MPFKKHALENGRKRIVCQHGHDTFFVEYGPMKKPQKGKRQMRWIARCSACEEEHHLVYGRTAHQA
jgi:hypothetical protein